MPPAHHLSLNPLSLEGEGRGEGEKFPPFLKGGQGGFLLAQIFQPTLSQTWWGEHPRPQPLSSALCGWDTTQILYFFFGGIFLISVTVVFVCFSTYSSVTNLPVSASLLIFIVVPFPLPAPSSRRGDPADRPR